MNIKEARQALEAEQGECWHERSGAEGRNHIRTKADTHGASRQLKGHVEACAAVPPDAEPGSQCGGGAASGGGRTRGEGGVGGGIGSGKGP